VTSRCHWDFTREMRKEQAIASVLDACRNTGKIPGFAAYTPEEARLRAAQGFLFLTAGSDVEILLTGARAGVDALTQ
jgi:2-keto-3-deoxy-L-rhamnonate aldolase RhmA